MIRRDDGAEPILQVDQAVALFAQHVEQQLRNVFFLAVGRGLQVVAGQDVVDVQGKLAVVQLFEVNLVDQWFRKAASDPRSAE